MGPYKDSLRDYTDILRKYKVSLEKAKKCEILEDTLYKLNSKE